MNSIWSRQMNPPLGIFLIYKGHRLDFCINVHLQCLYGGSLHPSALLSAAGRQNIVGNQFQCFMNEDGLSRWLIWWTLSRWMDHGPIITHSKQHRPLRFCSSNIWTGKFLWDPCNRVQEAQFKLGVQAFVYYLRKIELIIAAKSF